MGGGGRKVVPCLEKEEGARKVLNPQFSHFVAALPVINDQSFIDNHWWPWLHVETIIMLLVRCYISNRLAVMSSIFMAGVPGLREYTLGGILIREIEVSTL